MADVLMQTEFENARLINRGKVRDIYDAGDNMLIVTTDRISAFDVVMGEGIPYKGIVLNQLSKFWFEQTRDIIKNHFITENPEEFPSPFNKYQDVLKGRSMLVHKANPFPVECIVRGYLAGSGWKEYKKTRTVHSIQLRAGLKNSAKLPVPVFTPSTKAESGHDENITFDQMVTITGMKASETLKNTSLTLYKFGAKTAKKCGIIIADTKFEFGLLNGEVILIDEALTPDSSRFWPAKKYKPGRNQQSFDKQYLRDYLESLPWEKTPPPPKLPEDIIENTSKKYQEILKILTGKKVEEFL
jgi:phosphoribosylaminoimidazole-succinocarboxamide synthase